MRLLIGVPSILLGVALLAFSLVGMSQLRGVATDPHPVPADYPLLQLMTPEAAPGAPPVKPVELAGKIRRSLFIAGGVGLLLTVAGAVTCLAPKKNPEGDCL